MDSWSEIRQTFHSLFFHGLITTPDSQLMLANYHNNPTPFITLIRLFAGTWPGLYGDLTDDQIVQVVTREIGRAVKTGQHPDLAAAYVSFKIGHFCARNAKRNFLMENEMSKAYYNKSERIYSSEGLKNLTMRRLHTFYPPRGKWITESKEIHDLWHYHLAFDPKADNRLPRHEPIIIDPKRLMKTVAADESCIIRDEKTGKIVLIVLRSCFDSEVGEWLDSIIEEATDTRRNIRVRFFS